MSDLDNKNNKQTEIHNNITKTTNISADDYIGDKIEGDKDDQIFRVQSVNTNGLKVKKKRGGEFQEFCKEMLNHQVDLTCNLEINVDTTKFKVKEMIHNTARNLFDNKVHCDIASSSIKTKIFYKLGVTMIRTVGNYSGRVTRRGNDIIGRWSYQCLAGKKKICSYIGIPTMQTDVKSREQN